MNGVSRTASVTRYGRLVLTVLIVCLGAAPAGATIRYRVSLAQPQDHIFHVMMTVPDVRGDLVVQIPAWNALYQIRDFAQHVVNVRATNSSDAPLSVRKLDKQTWKISRPAGLEADSSSNRAATFSIEYEVSWDEPGAFSSQLISTHAFVNLATILFYVPQRRSEDVRLEITDLPAGWRVAAALKADASPTSFVAENYDALVDAPVEAGAFEDLRLEAGNARLRVVVHGDPGDRDALREMLRRVVGYQTVMMRDVPFAEFVFIYHFGQGGGGGMEHANSTAIFLDSTAWAAEITAHEFFHLWNVKRIRPQSLEPVDYTRENWTRALWFAEGVTSTYGAFTLVRTGIWTRQRFYDDLGGQISELQSRPAHLWKSVEEASLDAWLEKYPLYGRAAHSISYYNKGQLLGLLLDILIRDASDNRASLDDVLRYLNENYARRGRFYEDSDAIRAAAERVLAAAGGSSEVATKLNLAEFFARYVAGTDELPYGDILGRAGLSVTPVTRSRADFGFLPARGPGNITVVASVQSGSPAEGAGVRQGDVLLELNGEPFASAPGRWLRDHKPGETVRLRLRRDGEEKEPSFTLAEHQERGYQIEEVPAATKKQRRIREGLLRGTTDQD